MDRIFAVASALMGLLAVGLGAFGAHALEKYFEQNPDLKAIFKTATDYHMYHALALLGVAWLAARAPGAVTHAAGYLFLIGILVFSGSLYVLSVTGIRWLGAITPIGGVAFLAGWLCLGIGAWRGLGP